MKKCKICHRYIWFFQRSYACMNSRDKPYHDFCIHTTSRLKSEDKN